MSFNFEKLDTELAEAVHFETVFNHLSKANGRSIQDTAIVLNRAMSSFRHKHPYNGMEFKLYNYNPSKGFHQDENSATRHAYILNEIAKGNVFVEDSNQEGAYHLIDEFGREYTSYYAFYFKLSELLRFLIYNKVSIPQEFEHALPQAEKTYALYKKLIDKDVERFVQDVEKFESETTQSSESEEIKWGNFAGKETALKLIAGMAIALEKTQGKYVRGGKLNKSEVSRTARRLIGEHGNGIEVTDKALIMLIDEALSLHASKISA